MGRIIGHGRYARETYPSTGGSAGAAVSALRNRNVSVVPQVLSAPFSPGVDAGTNVAAILFTPKVSGVIQVLAQLSLLNGAVGDTYAGSLQADIGTSLTVVAGAGSLTSNGWIMGSVAPIAPPVIGGTILSTQLFASSGVALIAAENGDVSLSAISQPLPIGVPSVIRVALDAAGGNSLAAIDIASLSILELP